MVRLQCISQHIRDSQEQIADGLCVVLYPLLIVRGVLAPVLHPEVQQHTPGTLEVSHGLVKTFADSVPLSSGERVYNRHNFLLVLSAGGWYNDCTGCPVAVGVQAPLCRALVGVGTEGFSMASSRASIQRVSWNAPAIVTRCSIGSISAVTFFARVEVGSASTANAVVAHDTPPVLLRDSARLALQMGQ